MPTLMNLVNLFFNPKGKVSRLPYLIACALLYAGVLIFQSTIIKFILIGWTAHYVFFCLMSKRLRDIGLSPLWSLLIFLPVIYGALVSFIISIGFMMSFPFFGSDYALPVLMVYSIVLNICIVILGFIPKRDNKPDMMVTA